ncbi:hypothetical protein [Tepidibacter thalassicus]|uniref:Uncharacterized protein n=1 Tax=Tepidibacter thalassicus DSM 15285 TaxID=1123350 RepID=A0A1M5S8L8_9FIRM|nr:hypothetical protein [Tepidibacter thalassicus]SHH34982.1 hypothetical protein SAMN02744040_01671 [Tepidibacter thalassicus DSM 15285]
MLNWNLILCILCALSIIVILSYRNKNKYKYIFLIVYVITVSTMIVVNLSMNKNVVKKIETHKNTVEKNSEHVVKANENTEVQEKECINMEQKSNNKPTIVESEVETIKKDEIKISEQIKKYEEIDEMELVDNFKKEIYFIEKKALVPLRNCYSILKKIQKGKANIDELKNEAINAKRKCELVEKMYMELEVPKLKDKENVDLLDDARFDMQKAFYMRRKAMENGLEFLDTKNPAYIIKIKNELKISDELVHSCVKKINKVKSNLEKKIYRKEK